MQWIFVMARRAPRLFDCMLTLVLIAGLPPPALSLDWVSETADSAGNVGTHTSIALDAGGFPHISYYDESNEDLKYAYEDDAGWHTCVVDTLSYRVGWCTSLALDVAGFPRISYFGAVDLRYACLDDAGWHIETVHPGAYMGGSTSLAVDQEGFPHIAYYWQLSNWVGVLRYTYKDSDGWHLELVDDSGDMGRFLSLKLDDAGHAHIGYCDYCYNSWYNYPDDLRYAYRGASGWSIEVADGSGCVGAFASLDLDAEEFPHISYQEQVYFYSAYPKLLKYAVKDGAGWHTEVVDDAEGAGSFSRLVLHPDGAPRICYRETQIRGLTLASKLGPVWHLEQVDPPSMGDGSWPSMVLNDEGFPHIGCYAGNGTLRHLEGSGVSLDIRRAEDTLMLRWSPCPWASSYWCCGEENDAWFEPDIGNLLAQFSPDVFSYSVVSGIGDPASEWSFIVVARDASSMEVARSNRAGEREFAWEIH